MVEPAPGEDLHGFRKAWEVFESRDEFVVEKQGKKRVTSRDLRKLVLEGSWDGPVLKLIFSWKKGYLSPLFIIRSIFPQAGPDQMLITKTRQIMG